MNLRINSIIRHKTRRTVYIVKELLPIKIDGEWIEKGCVIYEPYLPDTTFARYARLAKDMEASFKLF